MDGTLPTDLLAPEQRLALSYASGLTRARFANLFALDRQLAQAVAKGAREPIAAQLRLAWWREFLSADAPLAVFPHAVHLHADWRYDPGPVIAMVDGWEELLAEPPDLAACARGRAAPFVALAQALGCCPLDIEKTRRAAERWALIDLAGHVSDPALRTKALELAAGLGAGRLPRAMRPLAVLDGLARRALARGGPLLGDRLSPLVAIRLGIFGW